MNWKKLNDNTLPVNARNSNTKKLINALTAVGALMTLIDFTLSNARRFYSSMGNLLAVKGLNLNVSSFFSWDVAFLFSQGYS